MPKQKDTKAVNAGAAVTSTIKSVGKDMKTGSVLVAKGLGSGAKTVATVFADFGRGLKKGWNS